MLAVSSTVSGLRAWSNGDTFFDFGRGKRLAFVLRPVQ
jgi:hypothetical protein